MRSLLIMSLIIDSHCDLAWNMLSFGRDYTLPVAETRGREQGSNTVERNGDTLDRVAGLSARAGGDHLLHPVRRPQAGSGRIVGQAVLSKASTRLIACTANSCRPIIDLTDSQPEYFQLIQSSEAIWMRTWASGAIPRRDVPASGTGGADGRRRRNSKRRRTC